MTTRLLTHDALLLTELNTKVLCPSLKGVLVGDRLHPRSGISVLVFIGAQRAEKGRGPCHYKSHAFSTIRCF